MGISRDALNRSTIAYKIVDMDPHTAEYEVRIFVTPPGYAAAWKGAPQPYAKVTVEVVGSARPYDLDVVDVADHGGIGHSRTLGALAKRFLRQRLNELDESRARKQGLPRMFK